MQLKTYHIVIAIALIIVIQALVLFAIGHSFVCPCGTVKLWSGAVSGPDNSQQLLDWYVFLHVMYGMALYVGGWFLRKKFNWKMSALFFLAVAISAGWEVFENTHFVINHYRINTASSDYFGDSIINSVIDTLTLALGFGLAYWLPVSVSISLFVGLALLTTFILRDNILLSTVTFIFPLSGVNKWQAAAGVYH